MMFCNYCGNALSSKWKYCPYCGKKIKGEPDIFDILFMVFKLKFFDINLNING